MSIYIKGMDMPKSCHFCELYEPEMYWCAAAKRDIEELDNYENRSSFCPLVPVPPHGDLMDRDKFRETMFIGEQCLYSWDEIEDAIDYAPVIIPAEPRKEENE